MTLVKNYGEMKTKKFIFSITNTDIVVTIEAKPEDIQKIRDKFGPPSLDVDFDGYAYVGDGWDFNEILAKWNKPVDKLKNPIDNIK